MLRVQRWVQHGAHPGGAHSLAGGRQTRKLKNYSMISAFTEILLKCWRKQQLTWGKGADIWTKLSAISIFIYPQLYTQKDMKKLFKYSTEITQKASERENLSELKIRVKKIRSKNITQNVFHRILYTCLNREPKLCQSLTETQKGIKYQQLRTK